MYEIYTANTKTEKRLNDYIKARNDIKRKLERLKTNPRKELDAHPLHGKLKEEWSCWLGSNIRMIYIIDDRNKKIVVEAVGSHKIY
ncbi:type II toxin-antitoxin system mRNA interferase toxin, RelE/StbE family [Candidatus Woesearchaeota archaeon]|nr:type II toxin-antitoxin system mRNA interferase toxin, RelE/StbE family [Candidatus Woesearchaeota archaeon]